MDVRGPAVLEAVLEGGVMRHLDCLSALHYAPSALAGVSDEKLAADLAVLHKRWDESRSDPDDEGHAGSPGEGLWEEIGAIDEEMARRRLASKGERRPLNSPRVTVSLPPHVIKEMQAEAHRLDRKLGWLVRRTWRMARGEIRAMPTVTPLEEPKRTEGG